MKTWAIRVVVNACALAVAAWLLVGITVGQSRFHPDATPLGNRILTLLVVALVFGLVNEFIRPIVKFLSLPLYLLTLGLMFFVVNALMLLLTSWVCSQLGVAFHVDGFLTALLGAIVVTVVSWFVGMLLPSGKRT
ncbi:MAG TPA: phage holin family protein [Nocardioidaceae bacterium]|nr:phage holin family protein [Nocardioidaceae bacterium]